MPLRWRPEGYGGVAKTLHWLTVAGLVAQFAVGYLRDVDDSLPDDPGTALAAHLGQVLSRRLVGRMF